MSEQLAKFNQHGLVSDVIDAKPPNLLTLKYGGISVEPGMQLTPTQVKDPPSVSYTADPNSFYTLIMTDPDAPSRKEPIYGEWQHWLIMNIPGSDVSKGDTVNEYVGSGPPKDTGEHRYAFLIFKQKGKHDTSKLQKLSNKTADGRPKQKTRELISTHKLGELVAGNFFLAEYDDYVPTLYKQLGF